MHRPTHFEIHVPDPAQAMAFYQGVFGWKFQQWGTESYWLVDTGQGNGINGGLMTSRDGQPRTINTIQVENVDEALAQVLAAGGQVAVPRMAIPGVGWLAYGLDPGGALFGIMHDDRNAK